MSNTRPMPRVRRRRWSRPAFTLVEILIVVAILGFTTALILPQIGNRDDVRTVSMARALMADLAYAQSRAMSTQSRQYVRFSPITNAYEVLDQFTPSERIIPHPVDKKPFRVLFGTGRTDDLKTVGLEAASFNGKPVVAFDELGTPYSYDPVTKVSVPLAAAGTIQLKSRDYRMTVSVEPFSGELKVTH